MHDSESDSYPALLGSVTVRIPAGSDEEYALVLPSQPPAVRRRGNVVRVVGPSPCYLVCEACVARLMGPRTEGKPSNPSGVRDALRDRYGDGYAVWTSPRSLPPMLDEAAEYLSSSETRGGVDFGTWQKMRNLQR